MTRALIGAALGAALLLAGCGDQPADNVTNIEVPSGEAYQERLLELNDVARNAVFLRALMDDNRDCQQVTQSTFAGRYKGVPAWSVTCRNQGEWLILIGNDGVAQVLTRRGAEEFGVVPQGAAGSDASEANAQQPADQAAP